MSLSPEIKKQYFNTPQMEAMYIAANTTVIVGGRRLGKSHGFGAPFLESVEVYDMSYLFVCLLCVGVLFFLFY